MTVNDLTREGKTIIFDDSNKCEVRDGSIDLNVFISINVHDEYLLNELVKPGCVFVDAGAHMGAASIKAASLGAKKIYGIESLDVNQEAFRKNVELNNYSDIITIVGKSMSNDDNGIYVIKDAYDNCYKLNTSEVYCLPGQAVINESSPDLHKQGEKVFLESISYKTFLSDYGIDRINVLKLDAEGGEYPFFSNAGELVDKIDIIVGEFHPHFSGKDSTGLEYFELLKDYFCDITEDMFPLMTDEQRSWFSKLNNEKTLHLYILLNKRYKHFTDVYK